MLHSCVEMIMSLISYCLLMSLQLRTVRSSNLQGYYNMSGVVSNRIPPAFLLSSSAIGLTLAALAFPAIAQDTGAKPASGPIALPTLSVEGSGGNDYKADQATLPKLTQPLRDTPQSISVVTQAAMQDQGVI